MNESLPASAASDAGWVLPPRSILVVNDPTLAAANAAWRAAQLAREHGASVRLLQLSPDGSRPEAARAALDRLAESMQQRLGVTAQIEVATGDLAREAARACADAGADLMVVPSREGRTWRERISGTSTHRMVRASRVPVLVVKRPLALARLGAASAPQRSDPSERVPYERVHYERVLACVDLGATTEGIMGAALSLGTQARLEVFHTLEPQRSQARGAGTAVESTQAALQARIESAGAQRRCVPFVGFGHAGAAILARERATGADLVVLGRRNGRLLGEFFLGAATQDVLSGSRCDLLLVPMPSRAPSAATGPAAAPAHTALG